MKEHLITFETAKLAKEKEFDWHDDDTIWINESMDKDSVATHPAPTQSLLQKWLREVCNIFVSIDVNYNCRIYLEDELIDESFKFHSYEQALEKGLQEALKLI